MLIVVLYGLLKITKAFISIAEIAIGCSFSDPVPYLFCNTKMLMVVIYGLLEITKTVISVAEIAISFSFSGPVPYLFCNT